MRGCSALGVVVLGVALALSSTGSEADLGLVAGGVPSIDPPREAAEPKLLAFNAYHFSGRPPAPGLGPSRGPGLSGSRGPQQDFGPYWPIDATGPPIGAPNATGQDPYWPIGLGPPTALRSGRGGPGGPSAPPPGRPPR